MRTQLPLLAAIAVPFLLVPVALRAQDTRADLLAADRAVSAMSGDSGLAVTLAQSLDRDGVLLWPGAPVVIGPIEATHLLGSISSPDTTRLVWQPLGVELAGDSTLGVTWGVAVVASRLTPAAPQLGRYTAVWRRAAGRWTISALLFMGVKPAAKRLPLGIPLTRSPVHTSGAAGDFVAADLAFARLAGDSGAVAAFRRWAAPDAIVSGGAGLLARGPDAIASGVAGPATWRWHPVAGGSSTLGDLGWTVGEAIITPERGEPNHSKYLTVWCHLPGRPIRFLTDGGNARPAPVNPR